MGGRLLCGHALGSGALGGFSFGGGGSSSARRRFAFLGLALSAGSGLNGGLLSGLLGGMTFNFKAFSLQPLGLGTFSCRTCSFETFCFYTFSFRALGFSAFRSNTLGFQSLCLSTLCRRTCGLGLFRSQALGSFTFGGLGSRFLSSLRGRDRLCIWFSGGRGSSFSNRFRRLLLRRSTLGFSGDAGSLDQGQGLALLAFLRALAALLAAQQEDDQRRQCDREEEERQQLHEDKGQWDGESIGPGALRRGVRPPMGGLGQAWAD